MDMKPCFHSTSLNSYNIENSKVFGKIGQITGTSDKFKNIHKEMQLQS